MFAVDVAMTRELDRWNEFGVTKLLSKKAAERHHEAKSRSEDRGDLVGADGEGNPRQARLQDQGSRARLHRDRCTHGVERRLPHDCSAGAQDGWDYNVFDALSAYLQSDGIYRLLMLRMPHKHQTPGMKPGQLFVATGSIDGTRDAGRACHEQNKSVLEAAGFVESKLDQGLYYVHGPDGPEAFAHTHVDDFLIAFWKASKAYRDVLENLVHTLHLKQQTRMVVCCGRTISKDGRRSDTGKVDAWPRVCEHRSGRTNTGKRTHERGNHWIPKLAGTIDVVGTAVADLCVCVSLAAQ